MNVGSHCVVPTAREHFRRPRIQHKFVKGLEGRENIELFCKSGTWRDFHADSAVVVRDHLTYIVVHIDKHPDAGRGMVDGIKLVDDLMLEYACMR